MVRLNTMGRICHVIIFPVKTLEYGSSPAIENQLWKTLTVCVPSLPDWSPSVLHRSILFIMDRVPQNEVPQAEQVLCNKTITTLLSIQILNFGSETY